MRFAMPYRSFALPSPGWSLAGGAAPQLVLYGLPSSAPSTLLRRGERFEQPQLTKVAGTLERCGTRLVGKDSLSCYLSITLHVQLVQLVALCGPIYQFMYQYHTNAL